MIVVVASQGPWPENESSTRTQLPHSWLGGSYIDYLQKYLSYLTSSYASDPQDQMQVMNLLKLFIHFLSKYMI